MILAELHDFDGMVHVHYILLNMLHFLGIILLYDRHV